jgi:hypothetical protein
MIYLIIIAILIAQIRIYDLGNSKKLKNVNYIFVLIVLIGVSGFRYRIGLDTIAYMSIYNFIPTIESFNFLDFNNFRYQPLYLLLTVFAKSISCNFFVFQIIHAVIVNASIFYFIKKNTQYIFSGIFFYFIFCFFSFNFEVLRESIAISIFLISYDFLIRKEWVKYYFFVFISFLFHSFSFFLAIIPFFIGFKVRFNIRLIVFSLLSLFLAIYIHNNFLSFFQYFAFTSTMADKFLVYQGSIYSTGKFNVLGILSNSFIFVIFPAFIVINMRKFIKKEFSYEFIVVLSFFIVILSSYIAIFYRIFNYLLVFNILLFSEFLCNKDRFRIYFNNYSISKFVVYLSLVFMIFLKIFVLFDNNNGIAHINRYYPYYSVFDEKISIKREILFSYYMNSDFNR